MRDKRNEQQQQQGLNDKDNATTTNNSTTDDNVWAVDDEALSLMFFELANVRQVGYRIDASLLRHGTSETKKKKKKRGRQQQQQQQQQQHDDKLRKPNQELTVTVQQDVTACGNHTGGIVWETSYLLLNYLLLARRKKLGRVLEVGAGCGLLGKVLGKTRFCDTVIMTEHSDAFANLEANNNNSNKEGANDNTDRDSNCSSPSDPHCECFPLDWCEYQRDASKTASLQSHSFDTIVGTDVVFTPSLVRPLLDTLLYMAHDQTIVYLCLQIRCEDSHKLLMTPATEGRRWKVKDVSGKLQQHPECAWGLQMECHLLKLTIVNPSEGKAVEHSTDTAVNVQKERKRKNGERPDCIKSTRRKKRTKTKQLS